MEKIKSRGESFSAVKSGLLQGNSQIGKQIEQGRKEKKAIIFSVLFSTGPTPQAISKSFYVSFTVGSCNLVFPGQRWDFQTHNAHFLKHLPSHFQNFMKLLIIFWHFKTWWYTLKVNKTKGNILPIIMTYWEGTL